MSISSLLALSIDSTAAAAKLVGVGEIGKVEGKRVFGEEFIVADVGASVGDFEWLFVESPVPLVVDTDVVLEDVVICGCAYSHLCVRQNAIVGMDLLYDVSTL